MPLTISIATTPEQDARLRRYMDFTNLTMPDPYTSVEDMTKKHLIEQLRNWVEAESPARWEEAREKFLAADTATQKAVLTLLGIE